VPESRCAVGQPQEFVDLFFVLGENELRFTVIEKIGRFLVEHVAIKTEAQGSDRMRGDFGGDPIRPVVANDANDVAARKTKLDHAEREITDAGLIVAPGERLPESKILFAQRDLTTEFSRVQPQHFWIGVGLRDAGGVIDHAAVSAGVGDSSGSTRTSSSSPR
jgi:hypothetical protein